MAEGIHQAILDHMVTAFQAGLIDYYEPAPEEEQDPSAPGVIFKGPLQEDPEPDEARISVTVHENDPDQFVESLPTGFDTQWADELLEAEVGGSVTWKRRFTVKARLILEETGENLDQARSVASTLRTRMERVMLATSFAGVSVPGEFVCAGVQAGTMKGEMKQSGGPEAYDYYIKIRFEVWTSTVPI